MLVKLWRKWNAYTPLMEVWISSTIVEDSVVIPQTPKDRNTIWPFNFITEYTPKEYQSFYHKDTWTYMSIAALFTIVKTWNQP